MVSTTICDPDGVGVLKPGTGETLTLVAYYPFILPGQLRGALLCEPTGFR
jgi:hypothetical protein